MANLFYFNTPSFVVPTTLNPAMAKTHRSRHWAKYVSSYPTSLDNKIPTTSLVLQGKFHEAPNVAPTFSRFVCFGFRWRPLLFIFLHTRALVIQCIVDNNVFIFFFNINGGLLSSNATLFSSSSLPIDCHSQTL